MTTIRDVAKHANVSVATVSRVLNKKGYVSKEALKAVEEAILELEYSPNSVARTLYQKTSQMIGLILPDITNPFFPELARAVEDVALAYGYTVVLCNTDEDINKEKKYIEALKQKYVDGIILTTNQMTFTDYSKLGLPMVALDRFIDNDIPTVVSSNMKGAEEATKYLIDGGCSFIAHLSGPNGLKPSDLRQDGFQKIAKEYGIASIISKADFNLGVAEEATQQMLMKHPTIDGIFASSDVTAAGAMKAAHTLGIKVPDDLQIVGFDGIPLGNMLVPALTTVAQPIYDMGALASRLLIKLIEKKPIDENYYELPTNLLIRKTTKKRGVKS